MSLVEALSDKSLIGVESAANADVPVRFRSDPTIRPSKSRRVFRITGNRRGIHAVSVNLAEIEYRIGDAESAVRTLAHALGAEGETRESSVWLGNMAAYQIALERWDEAAATARKSLSLARRFGVEHVVVRALQHLAAVVALRDGAVIGSAERKALRSRAASVLAYVDARLAATNETKDYSEQIEYERVENALRTALGAREYDAAYMEGTTIDLRAAIDFFKRRITLAGGSRGLIS